MLRMRGLRQPQHRAGDGTQRPQIVRHPVGIRPGCVRRDLRQIRTRHHHQRRSDDRPGPHHCQHGQASEQLRHHPRRRDPGMALRGTDLRQRIIPRIRRPHRRDLIRAHHILQTVQRHIPQTDQARLIAGIRGPRRDARDPPQGGGRLRTGPKRLDDDRIDAICSLILDRIDEVETRRDAMRDWHRPSLGKTV